MSVLDIGPSPALSAIFRRFRQLKYVTADLHQACDLRFDIQKIPLPNQCFDAILCSHVLEHVRDDRKALKELHRILKPQGWAYLQVPIDYSRGVTLQDPAINTRELRLKHYWDHDHVRLYGRDFLGRLQAAGFSVDVIEVRKVVQPAEAEHFGLDVAESLYLAKRRPSAAVS
jgi:SAM-dependent methyltransferase